MQRILQLKNAVFNDSTLSRVDFFALFLMFSVVDSAHSTVGILFFKSGL